MVILVAQLRVADRRRAEDPGRVVVDVRAAGPADAAPLAPLAEAALRATYAPIAQPAVYETVIAQSCTPVALAAAIDAADPGTNNWFLVAVEESALVGFLDFGSDGDGLELRRLYTRVGETGHGVGSALLSALEDRLAVGTEYRAIVHADNRRALSFWARHGFVNVGQVDTREHFADHRGLSFTEPSEPEPSLLLGRVVGALKGG